MNRGMSNIEFRGVIYSFCGSTSDTNFHQRLELSRISLGTVIMPKNQIVVL